MTSGCGGIAVGMQNEDQAFVDSVAKLASTPELQAFVARDPAGVLTLLIEMAKVVIARRAAAIVLVAMALAGCGPEEEPELIWTAQDGRQVTQDRDVMHAGLSALLACTDERITRKLEIAPFIDTCMQRHGFVRKPMR